MNDLKQPVKKRLIFNSLLVLLIMLGSFSLRELYASHPVVAKFFGGLNILVFWAIALYILYAIDLHFFGKEKSTSQKILEKEKKGLPAKKTILIVIVIILLFFGSLRFLDGLSFIIFWLVLIGCSLVIGFWIDRFRKKKQ